MGYYRCTGSIFIEGTMEQADYDFDMDENDMVDPHEPNEMEILNYMIESGIIQILHEDTEYFDDEEDEGEE